MFIFPHLPWFGYSPSLSLYISLGHWSRSGGCISSLYFGLLTSLLNGIEVFALWSHQVVSPSSTQYSSNIHPTTQPLPHNPQFPELTNGMILQFNLYVLNAINSNLLPKFPSYLLHMIPLIPNPTPCPLHLRRREESNPREQGERIYITRAQPIL